LDSRIFLAYTPSSGSHFLPLELERQIRGDMANFDVFLPLLIRFEGGYVDDPVDPGGATNKGITLRTFSECAKNLLGIEPTLDNLKALTDEQAGTIYKALYWSKTHGEDMASQDLANIVCDFYVNAGANATKLLQTILIEMGATLTVDGVIGPGSVQALRGIDQSQVYRRYKQGRIKYYENLVQSQPALGKFLKGWLNRVNSFPDL
jgi:lysozyme family protein